MATVTKENIGLLHEKLTVKLEKKDYLPPFEKALKDISNWKKLKNQTLTEEEITQLKHIFGQS